MSAEKVDDQAISWHIATDNDGVLLTLRRSDGWHLHVRLGDKEAVRSRLADFLGGRDS